jgi:hypothetical protein
MTWQCDAQQRRWRTLVDGWRAVVQQGYIAGTWRAAIAPAHGGLGQLAPVVFTSRIAAQAWCLGAIRWQHRAGARQQ